MQKEKNYSIETWQVIVGIFAGVITTEAIVIVFFFSTFPTKDAVSTQMDLRKQARDAELAPMRDDIKDIKTDVRSLLDIARAKR